MTHSFVSGVDDEGDRLDRVLARRLGSSRGHAQQLLAAGVVAVDGHVAAKSRRLEIGERVEVGSLPEPEPSAPPPRIPVRYVDEHLAVVAKPAGLVVHEGAGTTGPTLVDALQSMGMPLAATGDPTRPGIVHRLDRGTSGLLVVAKTEGARAGLVALFKTHDVDRRYLALVDGVPEPVSATIDAPIGRDPVRRTRFRVEPDGRRAVSHYDVVEAFGPASQIHVRLETGRTHQVRVHLSAVGHPVCGDTTYGADAELTRRLSLSRPALHAEHLGFTHPLTGEAVVVNELLPEDLQRARRLAGG